MEKTTEDNRLHSMLESWFLVFILSVGNLGVAFFVWHLMSFILDIVMGF
jgi:hypothetical protein